MAHGALPMMVPYASDRRAVTVALEEFADVTDGLVLQGGVDVSPRNYGEEPMTPQWSGDHVRDEYEFALIEAFVDRNKPVLGICRGCQVINVAFGGSLYQDINTQVPGSLVHRNAEVYERNRHEADLVPGSLLERIYQRNRVTINSVHHQAVKDLAPGFVVEARSTVDDIVEAIRRPIESHHEPWILGVQWHPEFQDPNDDSLLPTAPLLNAFFEAVEQRRPQS